MRLTVAVPYLAISASRPSTTAGCALSASMSTASLVDCVAMPVSPPPAASLLRRGRRGKRHLRLEVVVVHVVAAVVAVRRRPPRRRAGEAAPRARRDVRELVRADRRVVRETRRCRQVAVEMVAAEAD